MRCEPAHGLSAVEVRRTVCHNHLGAVALEASGALVAFTMPAQAGVVLRPDADPIADLDVAFCLRAYADGDTDDFVANAEGIWGWALDGSC